MKEIHNLTSNNAGKMCVVVVFAALRDCFQLNIEGVDWQYNIAGQEDQLDKFSSTSI